MENGQFSNKKSQFKNKRIQDLLKNHSISSTLDNLLEEWMPKKFKDNVDEIYELSKKQIDYLFKKIL